MVGRARDIVTPGIGGAPLVYAEDGFDARVNPDRTITSIEAQPSRIDLSRLVGVPCGEATGMPGGPAGLRFERARDRALAAAGTWTERRLSWGRA